MSILSAVDFSATSGIALSTAGRIATAFRQPLTVLTVVDPLLAAAERMQVGGDAIALLTSALEEFVDKTLGPGTASQHRLVVAVGDPATEILRQADADDPALMVLATQGASGVRKVVFGSVAERVLRTATRPVLVVPPGGDGASSRTFGSMEEVLVPIDFHAHALDDARVAHRVARASNARLRLLHVVPTEGSERWMVLPDFTASQIEEQMSGARQTTAGHARDALARLADEIGSGPDTTLEVVQGRVPDQIGEVAARADVDLVVLGLRGAPGVAGARVGAIAYRVLCCSPVPVLALPHETRAAHALRFLDERP